RSSVPHGWHIHYRRGRSARVRQTGYCSTTASRARTRAWKQAASFLILVGEGNFRELDEQRFRATVESDEAAPRAHDQARREDRAHERYANQFGAKHLAPFDMAVNQPTLRDAALVDGDGRAQEPVVADGQHESGTEQHQFDARAELLQWEAQDDVD